MKWKLLWIYLFSVTWPPVCRCQWPVYSVELDSELRHKLFDSYEVLQRPQNRNIVKAALNLLSLNYLDIKEQTMSITAYFTLIWLDPRLEWVSNTTFNDIRFVFSNENQMWTPAIIIENSVNDIDVISKPNVPMRIINTGRVTWMPTGIYTTYCESTVTYWPLDTQTCKVVLSSWAFTAFEVTLEFNDEPIIMKFYQENGEWELIKKESSAVTREREFEIFSRLIFTLKFRRRPLFHVLNTLFPVVLMGFLTVAIFKLSPESGERVGLSLTILLAYAVYLTLISESIPQTSISASRLSAYLATILVLQTLAVLLTVIYLDMYLTPDEKPVPRWLHSMTSSCLVKLACVESCRKTSKILPEKPENKFNNQETIIENIEVNDERSCITVDKDDNETHYTWKDIALLFDKVTMYLYLVLVTVLTVSLMIVMVDHYRSAYTSE